VICDLARLFDKLDSNPGYYTGRSYPNNNKEQSRVYGKALTRAVRMIKCGVNFSKAPAYVVARRWPNTNI